MRLIPRHGVEQCAGAISARVDVATAGLPVAAVPLPSQLPRCVVQPPVS